MKTAMQARNGPAATTTLPAPRGFGAAPGAAAPVQRSGRGQPSLKRKERDDREDKQPPKRHTPERPEDLDGYDADDDTDPDSDTDEDRSDGEREDGRRRGRSRLLVGEGDLSFARALTTRHPGIRRNLTATTYEPAEYQNTAYPTTGPQNKSALEGQGTSVLHGVNATTMADDRRLANRYPRIHFNFPHTGQRDGSTAKVIDGFFGNARRMQKTGDRVRMGMVKASNRSKQGKKTNAHYKGVYQIGAATRKHRYKLVGKRKFGSSRFPGYEHRETKQGKSARSAAGGGREYAFERVGTDEEFDTRPEAYRSDAVDTADETSDYTSADDEPTEPERNPPRRDRDDDDDDPMGGGGMGLGQLRPGIAT
jgi:hypothetical protein